MNRNLMNALLWFAFAAGVLAVLFFLNCATDKTPVSPQVSHVDSTEVIPIPEGLPEYDRLHYVMYKSNQIGLDDCRITAIEQIDDLTIEIRYKKQ